MLFMSNGKYPNLPGYLINRIKHPIFANPQLPGSYYVCTQGLAIFCFPRWFCAQLRSDSSDDSFPLKGSIKGEIALGSVGSNNCIGRHLASIPYGNPLCL